MRFTVAIATAFATLSSVSAQNAMQCGVDYALIPVNILQSNSCSMTGNGGGPNMMQCGGDGAGGGFFGLGTVLDLNLLQQNSCSMGQPASPFDAMNGGGGGLFFKEAKTPQKDDKKA